jgi:hypothetical protein
MHTNKNAAGDNVVVDIYPFIRRYEDGRIDRFVRSCQRLMTRPQAAEWPPGTSSSTVPLACPRACSCPPMLPQPAGGFSLLCTSMVARSARTVPSFGRTIAMLSDKGMTCGSSILVYPVFGPRRASTEGMARPTNMISLARPRSET